MSAFYRLLAGAFLSFLFLSSARSTQILTLSIPPISQISVEGNVFLSINNAVAGSELGSASDSSARLNFTTNSLSTQKITAATSGNLPNGITLSVKVNLDSSGVRINSGSGISATSAGAVNLSSTAATVVSNVNKAVIRNAPLTYTLKATAGAGELSATVMTITYTITNA